MSPPCFRFLTDILCIQGMHSLDLVNVTTDAPNHTVPCLLDPICVTSGFALMTGTGSPFTAEYTLDEAGGEGKPRKLVL